MHLSYLGLEPRTHHWSKFSGTRTQTCPLLHHIVFIVPFSVSLMWICIFRSFKCYLSVPLMLISQHFQETADEENLTKTWMVWLWKKTITSDDKALLICLVLFMSLWELRPWVYLAAKHSQQESINLLLRSYLQLLANGWFFHHSLMSFISGSGWKECVCEERYWW